MRTKRILMLCGVGPGGDDCGAGGMLGCADQLPASRWLEGILHRHAAD